MSVSIILPVHNAEATLGECLDSIQAQTLADFHLLAINDSSTDGSRDLLARRAASDPRIRVLDSPGRGLIDALNHGFQQCVTEFAARMDADDRMHPERLHTQRHYLHRHPLLSAVGCRVRVFPESQVGRGCREYIRWQDQCISAAQIADEIYREAPLANPGAMFRARAVCDLGGYRDGPFPEDYEFWLRLHAAGQRVEKVDAVLLDWRVDPGSYSRTHPRYARSAFDQIRSVYLAGDSRISGKRDVVFWGAGRKTRLRSSLLMQRGVRPLAYVDIDPNKIGNRIHDIPVVAPEWLRGWKQRPFVLNYVVNHGAPERVERDLLALGYRKGLDFVHVG